MAIKFDVPCKKVAFSVSNNAAGFSAAASAGASADHARLSNRDAADQHPISAITGLEEALENAGGASAWDDLTDKPFDSIDENTLIVRDGVLAVNTTDVAEQDNTKPITSSGVHVIVGNIDTLLSLI